MGRKFGMPMQKIWEFSSLNALSLLSTIADSLGVVVDSKNPILEGQLIIDGSRFEGFIPPLVKNAGFSIRKN